MFPEILQLLQTQKFKEIQQNFLTQRDALIILFSKRFKQIILVDKKYFYYVLNVQNL